MSFLFPLIALLAVSAPQLAPGDSVRSVKMGDETRTFLVHVPKSKDRAEVILYAIDGGGHTWPGRNPVVEFLGKSTKNINANDLIWDFFKRHPMP